MVDDYFALIMAGGGGTRLWPLSTKQRPKQSLQLFGSDTLFQISIDRIAPIFDLSNIYILTVEEQAVMLQAQRPEIPEANFIIEPFPRGTASVVGLSAVYLHEQDPEAVMACLTADHFIQDEERFRAVLLAAYEAAKDDHLVTLGIQPAYPDTGYGYIHAGAAADTYQGIEGYHARSFKEKPDRETAERYLAEGGYYWNSGMFVWKTERILVEFERQMPELYSGLMKIKESLGKKSEPNVIHSVWESLSSVTIDYGIMEGAQDVIILPTGEIGWLDVGDWGRIFNLGMPDEFGNVIDAGRVIAIDARNSLVLQKESGVDRMIGLIDIEDIVIIDTPNALLVCSRGSAERVKELVEKLKQDGDERYL